MNAQQLKNAILQEAIEGRLVSQDPNDEPASVLLQRIREEKKRLVKEGKLKKKDLEETTISEDEKPFEIPESWEWCRVKTILNVYSARRVHEKDWRTSGIPFYRAREIGKLADEGFVNNELFIEPSLYEEFSKSGVPLAGDLMVTAVGTLGKTYIVKEGEVFYYKDGSVLCFNNRFNMDARFLKYYIESPAFISQYASESQGTTVATLTMVRVNEYLIPLPPLAEQKRIVAKIEELMPKVEEYGKAQEALDKLNAELPEKLKKSILQEAIEGRLVPQDPNDEPASVLLDKIRKEKAQLVKEGKLKKKDLVETPISEDEKPFEIPESWEWVRLGSVCDYLHRGKSPKYGIQKKLPIIAQKCNQWDKIYTDRCLFSDIANIDKYTSEQYLQVGDVIINSTGGGTVGRTGFIEDYVFEDYPQFVADSHVTVVRANKLIASKYVYFYLISPYIQLGIEDRCSGSTNQIELGTNTVFNFLFPLPPLAEQHRIVAKIEELFARIEKLK